MKTRAAAIIPAAGSGTRMKESCPKQYLKLCGKPILVHSVSAFHTSQIIAKIVVVVPAGRVDTTVDMLRNYQLTSKTIVVEGGKRRQDSVKAGLDQLPDDIEIVLVHDGARPLVSEELIARCYHEARRSGAAIAAIRVKDTLKKGNGRDYISTTVDREHLWQAQTPQAAQLTLLRQAFDQAGDREVTDEASLLEMAGIPVKLVEGSEKNIKITRPEDLPMAEKIILRPALERIRIGHGFDAHRFATDRKLILAGVEIRHDLGLAGHSDADVVTHALCDAILGALAKGDIGAHFPDSSREFKDIYSILLLERVCLTMREDGYEIGNIDITVVCQEPKLAPYIEKMKKTMAGGCMIDPGRINIKATTTEKMGYTGRKEGICCHAVAFLAATEQE